METKQEIITRKFNYMMQTMHPQAMTEFDRLSSNVNNVDDYIIPFGTMRPSVFLHKNGGHKPVLSIPGNGINLGFHKHAISQVAEKTKIPSKYLAELCFSPDEWKASLGVKTLQSYFDNAMTNDMLLRTVNNNVMGFLSASYKRMDSLVLIIAFMEAVQKHNLKLIKVSNCETRFYIEAIFPEMVTIPTDMNGEITVVLGVQFSHSDFGDGALNLSYFMLQVICMNGATAQRVLRKIHLGEKMSYRGDFKLSAKTLSLETKTFASMLTDGMSTIFSEESIEEVIEKIDLSASERITREKSLILLLKMGMLKEEIETVDVILMENDPMTGVEGELTKWKLAQAIGNLAQKKEERRMRELYNVAGKLILS